MLSGTFYFIFKRVTSLSFTGCLVKSVASPEFISVETGFLVQVNKIHNTDNDTCSSQTLRGLHKKKTVGHDLPFETHWQKDEKVSLASSWVPCLGHTTAWWAERKVKWDGENRASWSQSSQVGSLLCLGPNSYKTCSEPRRMKKPPPSTWNTWPGLGAMPIHQLTPTYYTTWWENICKLGERVPRRW